MKWFIFVALIPLMLLSGVGATTSSTPSAIAGRLNTQPVVNLEMSIISIVKDLSMIVVLIGFAILMMIKIGAIKDPNVKASGGALIYTIILGGVVYTFAAYGVSIFAWIANFIGGLFS